MPKQMVLRLRKQDKMQALWDGITQEDRKELIRRYARLIARAARAEQRSITMEGSNEQTEP